MTDHEIFQAWRGEWSALVDAFLATDVGMRLIAELESYERPMVIEMLRAYYDLLLPDAGQEDVSPGRAEERAEVVRQCKEARSKLFRDSAQALTEMYRATARSENGARTRVALLRTKAADASRQIRETRHKALSLERAEDSGQQKEGQDQQAIVLPDQIEAFYRLFEQGQTTEVVDETRPTVRMPPELESAWIAASTGPTPVVSVPPTVSAPESPELSQRMNSGTGGLQDLVLAYCQDERLPEPLPVQACQVSRYPASPPPALKGDPADRTSSLPPGPDSIFSEDVAEVTTGEMEIDQRQLQAWEDEEIEQAFEDIRFDPSAPSSKNGHS